MENKGQEYVYFKNIVFHSVFNVFELVSEKSQIFFLKMTTTDCCTALFVSLIEESSKSVFISTLNTTIVNNQSGTTSKPANAKLKEDLKLSLLRPGRDSVKLSAMKSNKITLVLNDSKDLIMIEFIKLKEDLISKGNSQENPDQLLFLEQSYNRYESTSINCIKSEELMKKEFDLLRAKSDALFEKYHTLTNKSLGQLESLDETINNLINPLRKKEGFLNMKKSYESSVNKKKIEIQAMKLELKMLKTKINAIKDSSILSTFENFSFLYDKLLPKTKIIYPTKIFDSKLHGCTAKSFHQKCLGIQSTLILVIDANDNIFGGYNDREWTLSKNNYNSRTESQVKQNSFSFLFNLNLVCQTFIKNPNIFTADDLGPCFDFDFGFTIKDNWDISESEFKLSLISCQTEKLTNFPKTFKVKSLEIYAESQEKI